MLVYLWLIVVRVKEEDDGRQEQQRIKEEYEPRSIVMKRNCLDVRVCLVDYPTVQVNQFKVIISFLGLASSPYVTSTFSQSVSRH